MNQKIVVGYTTGVFDLFHFGHLNIIKQAKEHCDYLVVGVSTDELVYQMKKKFPEIPFSQRCEIVRSIRYVDKVVPETSEDKYLAWEELHYNILFKGSDAQQREIYKTLEKKLGRVGVEIYYFPYTEGVSSSVIKKRIGLDYTVDPDYCMSSYLSVRYIDRNDKIFKEGLRHRHHLLIPSEKKYLCEDAKDIDYFIRKTLDTIDLSKAALFLSGGMDSAILATYLPRGTKTYTVRCVGESVVDESSLAKHFAEMNNLEHTTVDATWEDYNDCMDILMLRDGAPIVPNEPLCYLMAKHAVNDGRQIILYGDAADTEFGGMDQLLSKDWTYEEWVKRFTFVRPEDVLRRPMDINGIFEPYRRCGDKIDFVRFIKEVYAISAAGAVSNACELVGLQYFDPYETLKMAKPINLTKVRAGNSKYLIRDLFKMKYPDMDIPEKMTMFRPVDEWLRNWKGPVRSEFIPGCIETLNGEQRLLVYCLEKFLNLLEKGC